MAEGTGGEIVAEFTKVIHEWVRMCKTYSDAGGCIKCPMAINSICDYISDDNDENNRKISKAKALKIEADIMTWAAEHPAPVYPTWADWFKQMEIVAPTQKCFHDWLLKPIPADIAQKLGIEPKEG